MNTRKQSVIIFRANLVVPFFFFEVFLVYLFEKKTGSNKDREKNIFYELRHVNNTFLDHNYFKNKENVLHNFCLL